MTRSPLTLGCPPATCLLAMGLVSPGMATPAVAVPDTVLDRNKSYVKAGQGAAPRRPVGRRHGV
ncbi:hypothetical protein [Cupriavidus oxalaticus]|uniref:Uncharacterized protein n=1 Tax=Cupriavidus oxalaticus TaxID=96344 RepID=A0A4P7LH39_9BURK|nr:hypothetical protein [Cupriavidus oxalaticus]QBY55446.1 hypothetical protein E0W60_30840 [Cupriavidus oxalaticus]